MDWEHALLLLVLLVLSGGLGVGAYLVARQSPENREKQVDAVLAEAELDVDAEARAALDRQSARRSTWGAAGGGLGFGLVMPVSVIGLGPWLDDTSLLGVGGFFVGQMFGNALSAQHPADRPTAGSRVSALQPRGWRDYVAARYLVAQAAFGLIGVAAAVWGLVVVTSDSVDVAPERGRMAVVLGTVVCAAVATATALQRRLLAAPAVAADESHLVVNDVVLATGLRDLFAATMGTAFFAGYIAVFDLRAHWWWIVAYLAVFVAVSRLVSPRLRPALVPVAHRLAARQPAA